MRVVKETLKKAGVVKVTELDRLMFDLNSMSRADGSGAPIELFLGRNVNTFLPHSENKFLSVRRDVERRRKMQVKWMDILGHTSDSDFKKGDWFRVQDQRTGVWSVKGEVDEVRDVQDGGPKSYVIIGESGGQYLRTGRFVKLKLSKANSKVRVDFSVAGG